MAGFFGYEKEHYKLSQKVGELVLFPRGGSPATEGFVHFDVNPAGLQYEQTISFYPYAVITQHR